MRHTPSAFRPPLALALQGGIALGYFGWGMLEGLLASQRVKLDALCGSHTGAINALLVADGMARGDEATAIQQLEKFWLRHAEMLAQPKRDAQAGLRQLLTDSIDFERLQRYSPVYLLVSANRVRDGHQRIFRSQEITAEVLCAVNSVPLEDPPVAIDGELYWDGGYGISLPLRQLVMETRADDVLMLLEDSRSEQDATPAGEPTQTRVINQRSLEAALQREIEAIHEMVDICLEEGLSHSRRSRKLQRLRLHHITADPVPEPLHATASPAWPDPCEWMQLRARGRQAAEQWLALRPQARMPARPARPAPIVERRQAVHA